MRVVLSVPALTGGVSTQPEPLRLAQQANRSDNMIATVVDGLRVRPPTEFQGAWEGFPSDPSKCHRIHTADGDYVAVAVDGEIRVFDVANHGAPLIVRNKSGGIASGSDFDYLDTSDPKGDIQFLTLNDYTLVLNRSKTVTASSTLTPSPRNQGLVAVLAGSYSRYYVVSVSHSDGDHCEVRYETHSSNGYLSGTSHPVQEAEHSAKTDVIAAELVSYLTTGLGAGQSLGGNIQTGASLPASKWTVTRSGSVFKIERLDGTDFKLTVTESIGGTAIRAYYQDVQLFSDLPTHAPVGMVLKVVGDPEQSGVGYYVKFVGKTEADVGEFSDGGWEESVKPGVSSGVTPSTMPHALLRQANGQFRWTPLDGHTYSLSGTTYTVPQWETRQVGDDDTNAQPDFVDKKIVGMCFHSGRLGLLGQEALMLSETRQPFNLYRTTVLDLIDSDRVEVKIPTTRAEKFRWVVPMGGDIVLFADQTQFLLRSDGPLTPNTISLTTGSRYDSGLTAVPVEVRDSLFVPSTIGAYGRVQELRAIGDRFPALVSLNLTASADRYVGLIREMAVCPQLDTIVMSSGTAEPLWVYTHFFNGQEKVQQAWQKWTFGSSPTVRHLWFDQTDLHLVLDYGSSVVHHMKMRLDPAAADGALPLMRLDRRVSSASLTKVYANSRTTITLPWTADVATAAIVASNGKAVRVYDVDGSDVIVDGDYSATALWIGVPFDWRHDLSKVYLTGEHREAVLDGTLRLDQGSAYYADSGPFQVVVMADSGSESTSWFSGPYLGMGANYQSIRLTSGVFRFPVRGRATETRISLRGDGPWGAKITGLDVQARSSGWGPRQ